MTPERAGELASEMRNEWMHNGYHDSVGKIAKVILRACAEERVECAKIAENEGCDQTEYRCGTIERIAAAIRGAK